MAPGLTRSATWSLSALAEPITAPASNPPLIDRRIEARRRAAVDVPLWRFRHDAENTGRSAESLAPTYLGERFVAADILWGTSLTWMTGFKILPELPEIMAYIGRINSPSVDRQGQGRWMPNCRPSRPPRQRG